MSPLLEVDVQILLLVDELELVQNSISNPSRS
jgi:hypothetical protein